MRCLVHVKFLPGGSLSPQEFFTRINAQWSFLEDQDNSESRTGGPQTTTRRQSARSAMCLADYDSVEQLALDLAIMPGAGLSAVEVVPVTEEMDTPLLEAARSRVA